MAYMQKTSKTKKNKAKTKQQKKKKKIYKNTIEFILCWPSTAGHRVLPLSVVSFPSETPLEKTTFSFASGYQLEMASELGMWGLVCTSPLIAWISFVADLCRSCAFLHSLCVFMHASVFGRPCFFGVLWKYVNMPFTHTSTYETTSHSEFAVQSRS